MMLPKLPKLPKLPNLLKLPKMKLRFTSSTVGVLILVVTISLIIVSVRYDAIIEIRSETPEPPIPTVTLVDPIVDPIVVPAPKEVPEVPLICVVEVVVESLSGMYQGGGLRVGNIIVTSAMIFVGDNQIITVDGIETFIIKRDDSLGLVALQSEVTVENLSEVPCPPVGVQAKIAGPRDYQVEIFRYMSNRDQMILTGDVPTYAAGYPVMFGIDVVGIVVGLNSANVRQGIAVSKQGLVKFLSGDFE